MPFGLPDDSADFSIPTFDVICSDVEGFMDERWEFQALFHGCFTRSEPRVHFLDYMVGQFRGHGIIWEILYLKSRLSEKELCRCTLRVCFSLLCEAATTVLLRPPHLCV